MFGNILLCVTLFPLILWLVYWCCRIIKFQFYLWRIKGPIPLPLLGNVLDISKSENILDPLMKYYEKYNGSFVYYIGSQPYFYLCDPKDVEFLLTSNKMITKSDLYTFMYNWLGVGLLNSGGDRWRKHRKIIMPAFHFRLLEGFIEVFNSRSDILVSKLTSHLHQGSFDVFPYITRFTLDVLCETAMGTSVNAQDDIDSEYLKSILFLFKMVTKRVFSPILSNDFLYSYTKICKEEKHALDVVHGYSRSMIKERKEKFFGNVKLLESVDYLGIKRRRAFLDLMLEHASNDPTFTEEDIRQEVDTFMMTGQSTTASAITFAFHALATHPDVQHKVYMELQTIFANDPNRKPSRKDLQDMTYLETVIMESLRLHTTIPIFGRMLDENISWHDGTTLPKGLMIVVFAHAIHTSNSIYEDPQKFNPDRFTPENFKERNQYSYVPFSSGVRSCAGQKFALLELKSVISNVLRNFELLPAVLEHEIKFAGDGVLRPENGIFLKLKPRN